MARALQRWLDTHGLPAIAAARARASRFSLVRPARRLAAIMLGHDAALIAESARSPQNAAPPPAGPRVRPRHDIDRPEIAVVDILQGHGHDPALAVDVDAAEELQAETRREVLALLALQPFWYIAFGPNVLSSAPAPRCRHAADRRRIPRTARNPETPRGSDRNNARRCNACRR